MNRKLLYIFLWTFILVISFHLSAQSIEGIQFSADSVTMSTRDGQDAFILNGNAKIRDKHTAITADQITVVGKNSTKIEAKNNVIIIDEKSGLSISGFTLSYQSQLNHLQMTGNVELKKITDTFIAKSMSVEIVGENRPITMRGSVRIYRGDLFARSDLAIYDTNSEQLQLIGNTYLVKDGQNYQMDRTTINLKTNEISLEGGITGTMSDDTIKIGS
ncbi:MAG: LptA/OstA family protein [Spirochaetia bacterium]